MHLCSTPILAVWQLHLGVIKIASDCGKSVVFLWRPVFSTDKTDHQDITEISLKTFATVFTCLSGVHAVLFCDLNCHFRVKSHVHLYTHLFCKGFKFYWCYLYYLHIYWCSTRFLYHRMFVSLKSNTTAYSHGGTWVLLPLRFSGVRKTRDEPRYSRRESCFCYTIGTRRVNIATNPMKSHECEGQQGI
jgi:hypothetical protein